MSQIVKVINAEYGINDIHINITSQIINLFFKNNSLKIYKGTELNKLFKDPCFLYQKLIKITVSINENIITIIESEYDGRLLNDIIIDSNFILDNYTQFKIYNNNCKNEFRVLCFNHLDYIRNLNLPDFSNNSDNEAVLIEYRCLPHLEFLIRNAIVKLGKKWSHTIICGNLNYDFMVKMCSSISSKINVIKTNFDNLYPSEYSKFLTTSNFWNLLHGEKILIYQEDSIIFKNNVDAFLKWDYIGAPWPEENNDNKKCVGNGGFSLRTRKIMLEIINRINVDNTILNSSTVEYMKKTNSHFICEDVYFTKNMEDLGIGLLADRSSAFNFSTESILNNNSFGGHSFWLNDANWKNRIFENIVIQFKPTFDLSLFEHRGGWKSILQNLNNKRFYNNASKFEFFDMVEFKFMWNPDTNFLSTNKWSGIVHCTPKTPDFLNISNINNLFVNKNFIKSLDNCNCIITMSSYITNYLYSKFNEINKNIRIYTLKYPVDSENIKYFNFNDYKNNHDKKLIQIGQQLRKVTSIYLLNIPSFKKIWLTGTRNLDICKKKLEDEVNYFNHNKNIYNNNVLMYYTNTFEEYDDLLSKNIVFIDLFDAAANTVVLECIIRNTPIIVNKLEPVIEYLGTDYPLYFNNLSEVPDLLTNEKLLQAHYYLCKMNKNDLSIDHFTKNVINIINENFM